MSRGERSLVSRQIRAPSRFGIVAAGFIACAMVLGGGGSPNPASELALQLVFVAALLVWLWWARDTANLRRLPRSLLLFGCALLAIPSLQLIPLPPAVWHALPARELAVASLERVGATGDWAPLSISPGLTLAGVLALIPAVGAMFAAARLPHLDVRTLIQVIALTSLAGAFLGAIQLAGGPDDFRVYDTGHRGWLTAFHANRNAAADVLLIGSLALSAWFASANRSASSEKRALPFFAAAQLVFLAAILMTGSRAGIALLAVSIPFHGLILLKPDTGISTRGWLGVTGTAALIILALPLALGSNARLARVVDRFDASSDARFPLWEDSWRAVEGFWPVGSGIGTFPVAFQPYESLEYLDAGFANRAHNDYLELFLELGVLAVPLLLGAAIYLAILARRALRLSRRERSAQMFACGTLTIVALHSIVDYPLRNMAIACLAGIAVGLLASVPRSAQRGEREGEKEAG